MKKENKKSLMSLKVPFSYFLWGFGAILVIMLCFMSISYTEQKGLSEQYQNSSLVLCNYANSLTDLANLQETIIAQLVNKTDEMKFLNKLNCTVFKE